MLAFQRPVHSPFDALPSSLSLSPPHRPTSLHQPLVSSHAWLDRFAHLQTLGDPPDEFGGAWGAGHQVVRDAYGSTGCVNAMDWEEGGEERLATAGDDTKICIWKAGLDTSLYGHGSEAVAPDMGYGLSETIDTGHRANIFSVKWAPGLSTRLFSCAGDATVRVYDLSLATNSSLSSANISVPSRSPWVHHENETACTRVFRCHTSRVKRIVAESQDVILTCGEDGTVRQHDLRTPHQCRTRLGSSAESSCPPPLASYGRGMSLYSLSLSKLRPHLFVVAGTSPYAYLHDRRMIRTAAFQRDWSSPALPYSSSSSALTHCVRRFGVPHATRPWNDITNHIVATKLSPSNANELAVSYSDRGVYLFDLDGEAYDRPKEPVPEPPKKKAKRAEREKTEGGLSDEEMDRMWRPWEEADGPAAREDRGDDGDEVRSDGDGDEVRSDGNGDEAQLGSGREAMASTPGDAELAEVAEGSMRRQARTRAAFASSTEAEALKPSAAEQDSREPPSSIHSEDASAATQPPPVEGARDVDMPDEEPVEVASLMSAEEEDDEDEEDEEEDEDEEESDDEEGDESDSGAGENNPFIPGARMRYHHPDVPMVAPKKHYEGHANTQTVKDINFAFDGSMIVSGSDDGSFFLWDKESTEIKGIFKGDSSVVNVLQPHPRLPILAVSGIDSEVKLFGPTSDKKASTKANLVGDKERIAARNRSGAEQPRFGFSDRAIFQLLAARLQQGGVSILGADDDEDEGEDDGGDEDGEGGGEGGTRRRRIRVAIDPAQGGDCVVM
ncbi:hypothetical protein JCM10207_005452 [Rhodosporidiobolus poonsookiae]